MYCYVRSDRVRQNGQGRVRVWFFFFCCKFMFMGYPNPNPLIDSFSAFSPAFTSVSVCEIVGL